MKDCSFGKRLPVIATIIMLRTQESYMGKPDPEPYLFAAMMLEVEPVRCVVIEDAPAGIQAGRAAGMHVVGVVSSAYGSEELSQAHVVGRKLGDITVVSAVGSSLGRLILCVKEI